MCEKPFTVNAEQTRILARLAREKKLFLMEAVWTRFFPLSIAVREYVKSGQIGTVKRVIADLSLPQTPETHFADSHRMVSALWYKVLAQTDFFYSFRSTLIWLVVVSLTWGCTPSPGSTKSSITPSLQNHEKPL